MNNMFIDLVSSEGIIPFQNMISNKEINKMIELLRDLNSSLGFYERDLYNLRRHCTSTKNVDFCIDWLKPLKKDCRKMIDYLHKTRIQDFKENDHGEKLLSIAFRAYMLTIYMRIAKHKSGRVA